MINHLNRKKESYTMLEIAVVKAKIENINTILVSATPSLETYKNCKEQKYFWLKSKKI